MQGQFHCGKFKLKGIFAILGFQFERQDFPNSRCIQTECPCLRPSPVNSLVYRIFFFQILNWEIVTYNSTMKINFTVLLLDNFHFCWLWNQRIAEFVPKNWVEKKKPMRTTYMTGYLWRVQLRPSGTSDAERSPPGTSAGHGDTCALGIYASPQMGSCRNSQFLDPAFRAQTFRATDSHLVEKVRSLDIILPYQLSFSACGCIHLWFTFEPIMQLNFTTQQGGSVWNLGNICLR